MEKFYGYYAQVTDQARKAFRDWYGADLYSFEVVQRGDEFLVIGKADDIITSSCWLAIVYDLDALKEAVKV